MDVEPNGFQLDARAADRYSGFEALLGAVEELRASSDRRTGDHAHFSWFFRMDPQIEEVFGCAEFVVDAYKGEIERLHSAGDARGIHVHPLRRIGGVDGWVHDFADPDWASHCLAVASEAFTRAFGESPRLHRFGAGVMSDSIMRCLDRLGVVLDMTPEPGTGVPAPWRGGPLRTGVDESPRLGVQADCRGLLRRPYAPTVDGFRSGSPGTRGVTVLPLSATAIRLDKPLWWRSARTLGHGFRPWVRVC